MDPLTAIGLASAVAQFIQVGFAVGKRLAEYNKASPNEVPRSLQSINNQLPLLINALQRVKSDVELNKFDFDTRCILKGVISGCMNLVEQVESILNKVIKQQGETLTAKVRKTLASFKHDESILALDKNLQTYVNILILHHVIEAEDVPAPPPEDYDYYEVKEKRALSYVDRDDLIGRLDELFYDAARGQNQRPKIVVLMGHKGAGKTQLALEYCRQSHAVGQFRTVFWLNARSPEALDVGLEGIAAVVRRTTEGSREEKLDFVKNFLSERWHPWLLVLDGYDHKAFDYTGPLKNLPSAGYGAVLFTTTQSSAYVLGETMMIAKYLTTGQQEALSYMLMGGIQSNDFDKVKQAVEGGVVINALNPQDWPHLARAAIYGDSKIFKYLLDNGADPFFFEGVKAHPMLWASAQSSEIVSMLLDYEDRNDRKQMQEAYGKCLHEALKSGNENVVRSLFDRRLIDPNSKDAYGRSMLWNAVNGKNEALTSLIISRGLAPTEPEERGKCLHAAITDLGSIPILKQLIEGAGFDPLTEGGYGTTPLADACQISEGHVHDFDRKPNTGVELTEYLLSVGADPNIMGKGGDTPLICAAGRGSEERVKMLLAAGADPLIKNDSGHTPLTAAAMHYPDMFPLLLGHKPYPQKEKWLAYLNHALQYGARKGYRELVQTVLRFDEGPVRVDINSQDWRGETPLLLAISNGHVETARLLIRNKPRQDIADKEGNLPLLLAASKGFDLTVRDLLKQSKQPNLKNKNGDTALCVAAAQGFEKVVKVLLDFGADLEEANKFGDIPLDLAEEKGHKKVIELLAAMELKT